MRKSKQPFAIHSLNLEEINDCFRRIQDELDRLAGLRGTVIIYDSQQYRDDQEQILHGFGVKP